MGVVVHDQHVAGDEAVLIERIGADVLADHAEPAAGSSSIKVSITSEDGVIG
jgi:hypothetical protein